MSPAIAPMFRWMIVCNGFIFPIGISLFFSLLYKFVVMWFLSRATENRKLVTVALLHAVSIAFFVWQEAFLSFLLLNTLCAWTVVIFSGFGVGTVWSVFWSVYNGTASEVWNQIVDPANRKHIVKMYLRVVILQAWISSFSPTVWTFYNRLKSVETARCHDQTVAFRMFAIIEKNDRLYFDNECIEVGSMNWTHACSLWENRQKQTSILQEMQLQSYEQTKWFHLYPSPDGVSVPSKSWLSASCSRLERSMDYDEMMPRSVRLALCIDPDHRYTFLTLPSHIQVKAKDDRWNISDCAVDVSVQFCSHEQRFNASQCPPNVLSILN
jgi:hypothetical protein